MKNTTFGLFLGSIFMLIFYVLTPNTEVVSDMFHSSDIGIEKVFAMESSNLWNERLSFPSEADITLYNSTSISRSPYVCGWFSTSNVGRFTEYEIDFKSDYAPTFTYCSVANFYLDYSSIGSLGYSKAYCDGISGYAGFQKLSGLEQSKTILSLWDVHCENDSGQIVKNFRPTLVYPEPNGDESFGGEGTGAHHLTDYTWKSGVWYRMVLKCDESTVTNSTHIQQWVCELPSGNWTKLCEYDLGFPNVVFKGDTAVFLENFDNSTSGDIRTMEIKNVRVKAEGSDKWTSILEGKFSQNYGYSGSYNFGSDGDVFWIITSGISGIYTKTESAVIKVKECESSSPYERG